MRLPKPIYEAVPFFLVGVGILFIVLVLHRYEHAPTLIAWFAGLTCIIGGSLVLAVRIVYRTRKHHED